jgi:hypothetical protein
VAEWAGFEPNREIFKATGEYNREQAGVAGQRGWGQAWPERSPAHQILRFSELKDGAAPHATDLANDDEWAALLMRAFQR